MAIKESQTFSQWKPALEKYAQAEGLLFLGIAELGPEQDFTSFKSWLDKGYHGEMGYLENYQDVRANPLRVSPHAKSAAVFGFRYGQRDSAKSHRPRIAQYAQLKDYHRFLKTKIERVDASLREDFLDGKWHAKALVDTAPILERSLARHLPSCFVGKNTCLIHKDAGSFLLLGELVWDLSFEGLEKETINAKVRNTQGGCGSCRRCQVHCPTGALKEDFSLDARRCISYWTIEHRGVIPTEFWSAVGKYWYGCDICQNVCPYNRVEASNIEARLKRFGPEGPDLIEVACMDQDYYEKTFGGTPMTRAKISGLRRNALIALYVSKSVKMDRALEKALSSGDDVLMQTAQMIVEQKKDDRQSD